MPASSFSFCAAKSNRAACASHGLNSCSAVNVPTCSFVSVVMDVSSVGLKKMNKRRGWTEYLRLEQTCQYRLSAHFNWATRCDCNSTTWTNPVQGHKVVQA